MTDTAIIVAGDCGFGFERPGYYKNVYNRCKDRLSKANNWLLIDDVERERKVMDQIHDYLYVKNHPLQYWYYGHFHQTWHAEIEGIKYNMLDCMELREIYLEDNVYTLF